MKKLVWIILAIAAGLAILTAMAVAAFLLWGLPQEIGPITINGELIDLHGAHGGHWAAATLGILVAMVVVAVVVPTVVMVAVFVPLLMSAMGLLIGAAVLGLVLSPVWLLGLWLWRRRRKTTTMAA